MRKRYFNGGEFFKTVKLSLHRGKSYIIIGERKFNEDEIPTNAFFIYPETAFLVTDTVPASISRTDLYNIFFNHLKEEKKIFEIESKLEHRMSVLEAILTSDNVLGYEFSLRGNTLQEEINSIKKVLKLINSEKRVPIRIGYGN